MGKSPGHALEIGRYATGYVAVNFITHYRLSSANQERLREALDAVIVEGNLLRLGADANAHALSGRLGFADFVPGDVDATWSGLEYRCRCPGPG